MFFFLVSRIIYIMDLAAGLRLMRGGEQICEVMNKYFSNIGNHLASPFDCAEKVQLFVEISIKMKS